MGITVTLCAQPQQKRRENKDGYSFFRWSEAESLPHLIEFETPTIFQLAKAFGVNSQFVPRAAAESQRSGNVV
jgi:hypothetical protein